MRRSRRSLLSMAGLAALLPAFARTAAAQAYPTRPVRFLVGFPAGGPNDILARLIGQWLSDRLGQPFVVENRPGASGNLATEAVVRAPADGYTILLVGPANAIGATLYADLSFNFLRDIAPVAGITREPLVMVVHPSVPATTVAQFIADAKAHAGTIKMASTGNGSSPHVSGELFKMMAGLDLPVVHYSGGGPALQAMIGGDRADQERQAAPAGGDHDDACVGAARCPCARRCRAGLRGERGDWHRCSQQDAGGHHHHAQHGG
jgi:tripartite-type tricarboxylate transporter receptor subunit TctC